jgi:hypothetical protein
MRAATIVGVENPIDISEDKLTDTLKKFNAPIEILNDVKVPEVPDNRILVNIKASSLCSSDLMEYRGYIPSLTKKPLPYCGGHERQFPIICPKFISSKGDPTDFPQSCWCDREAR